MRRRAEDWEATFFSGPYFESGFIRYVRAAKEKACALTWVGPFVFDGAGWRESTVDELAGYQYGGGLSDDTRGPTNT